MKKIVAIILSLVMVLSLAGCGEVKKAEEVVTNMFEAFKAGDFDKAEAYLVQDEDADGEDEESDESDEMFNHVFTKLEYTIGSCEKISGEEVQVTASVTAPDMKVAVGEFFTKALEFAFANAFSENPLSEEDTTAEMERIFVEATEKDDLGTVTNEVAITVVKTEEGWKVKSDDALVDAISGGMMTAFQEMEQSLSEDAAE